MATMSCFPGEGKLAGPRGGKRARRHRLASGVDFNIAQSAAVGARDIAVAPFPQAIFGFSAC